MNNAKNDASKPSATASDNVSEKININGKSRCIRVYEHKESIFNRYQYVKRKIYRAITQHTVRGLVVTSRIFTAPIRSIPRCSNLARLI